MESCKFSKEADKDIAKIHTYTIHNFGYKQAKEYSANIYDKIKSIATREIQGRKAFLIKEGLRKLEVGSHIVLYKDYSGSIFIVRILHKSMDIKNHI